MLTNRGKYATRAVLELSIRYSEGPVRMEHIAREQNIPIKFLEQILLSLKGAGFVESRKGPGGGYYLSRPPSAITLGAVTRSIDGPLALVSCVSMTRNEECGCPHPANCGLRLAWQEARDALAGVLDRTTFADICGRHKSRDNDPASDVFFDYSI